MLPVSIELGALLLQIIDYDFWLILFLPKHEEIEFAVSSIKNVTYLVRCSKWLQLKPHLFLSIEHVHVLLIFGVDPSPDEGGWLPFFRLKASEYDEVF